MTYDKRGVLRLLPNVELYYNPQSLANIMSMSSIAQNYRITMESSLGNTIMVHVPRAEPLKF